jgi:L-ribulokinase
MDPAVFEAAHTWVECCDYIPAILTGTEKPGQIKPSRCAAGHKAMFNDQWGGLPSKEFLSKLDPKLADLRDRLYEETYTVETEAGKLTQQWAQKLGLPAGIPVAVGAFDAHLGAVGSGIGPGKLVKIIGTSTCDMLVSESGRELADIPGICGIVDGSILPGYIGLEAGQSAVGDIFNWFVNYIQPGGPEAGSHEALTENAAKLKAGQSGLLALDWNNGNRTVLVDQRLTGLLIGQTLHTRHQARRDLPRIDRGNRIRRSYDHQQIRAIRRGGCAGHELRRDRREESIAHANLCRRDRKGNGDISIGAELCSGRCNRRRGRGRRRSRRT